MKQNSIIENAYYGKIMEYIKLKQTINKLQKELNELLDITWQLDEELRDIELKCNIIRPQKMIHEELGFKFFE